MGIKDIFKNKKAEEQKSLDTLAKLVYQSAVNYQKVQSTIESKQDLLKKTDSTLDVNKEVSDLDEKIRSLNEKAKAIAKEEISLALDIRNVQIVNGISAIKAKKKLEEVLGKTISADELYEKGIEGSEEHISKEEFTGYFTLIEKCSSLIRDNEKSSILFKDGLLIDRDGSLMEKDYFSDLN